MKPLTERQRKVLELIRQHLAREGMPPTRAEIARALGFSSTNTADAHLRALTKKGYIELVPGRNRNIRLREMALPSGGKLPVIGMVAAGAPILAAEHIEGYSNLETLFHPQPDYFLRVRGMSMGEAGILENDLLAVKRNPEADSGQIVVARLDDEVTVKRLELDGDTIRRSKPVRPADTVPVIHVKGHRDHLPPQARVLAKFTQPAIRQGAAAAALGRVELHEIHARGTAREVQGVGRCLGDDPKQYQYP